MSRVPDIPDFAKLNFITAYAIQGCEPPFWALVEFAKEPAKDLLMLMIGLDAKDIVTSWLRPERQRARNAARHGRKRPFRGLSLDPNEYIADRPRAAANGWPGLKLPGSRALFFLDGIRERIAIQAAVLEGVTNIGYESVLGVISAHPEKCPNMHFVHRHNDFYQIILGASQADRALSTVVLDASQGFQSTNQGTFMHPDKDWYLGGSAVLQMRSDITRPIGMTIWSQDRGKIAESFKKELGEGEAAHFWIGSEIKAGEWVWLGRWNDEGGSLGIIDTQALGFAGGLW